MASQSYYRKWRSQTFSDLIGQEAVTRTLLNAVRDGRLAHAYLFCGPRGTGKTSAARLLAKAINCQNPHDGEPCNECVSCQEITAGRSPDVIEIDGASNNGVDNIRELRENVNLMGSGGHYKVYIIDEAHMITPQAFNALLKTLEEPPPHIIFVFATTEAQKMLPTVVSRCQRFDFHRFRMADIIARLRHVADGEGLTLEPTAVDLLARAAQGGMRDALSLLDQAVALCGDHVDLERTRAMLGLADVGALRRVIACVAENRAADALDQLNEMVTNGADLRQLKSQFAEEWRGLMLARAGADLMRVLDCTEDEARDVAALAERFSLDDLMTCARVFARNDGPARGLPTPQLALELALLECLSIHRRVDVAAQPPTQAPVRAPQPAAPSPAPTRATTPQPPRAAQPAPSVEELDLAAIDAGTWAGPAQTATPAAPAPSAAEPMAAPAEPWDEEPAPDPGGADGRDWVAEAQRNWSLIRKICRQKPPMGPVAGGLLSAADPVSVTPGDPPVLVIRTKFEIHLNKFREPEMRGAVEWALEQALGAPLRTHFISGSEPQRGGVGARNGAPVAQASATQRPHVYERGVESASGANGANGATGVGNSGQHATTPQPSQSSQASRPPAKPNAGRTEIRERPAQPVAPTPTQLEQAAREDPVVQEFARMLHAEVGEVRALDTHDGDES
jgi:DNA polymerase III subunit gamma/tau